MGDEMIVARIDAKLDALEGRVGRMQEALIKQEAKINEINTEFIRRNERIRVAVWVLTGAYTILQGIPGILAKLGIGG